MATKKVDPKLEKAALKLGKFLSRGAAAAASATVSTLITLFASVAVPVLAELLTELLKRKDAKRKYGKFLIAGRNVLDNADLGDA